LNWDRKNIKGFQSCHPLDRGTGVLEREKLVVCWGIRGIRGMGGIGGIGLELQVGEPQVVTSEEESFLEKNAMGAQEPQTSYCKTPPTFVFEASTATEIGVFGTGWTRVGRDDSRTVAEEKAEVISGDQIRAHLDPLSPFSASVNRAKTCASCILDKFLIKNYRS